jgi:hypothetical protein
MEYWRNYTDRVKMKYCEKGLSQCPSWAKEFGALSSNLKPNLSTSAYELRKYTFVNSDVMCGVMIIQLYS